jgi:hypothetical protein
LRDFWRKDIQTKTVKISASRAMVRMKLYSGVNLDINKEVRMDVNIGVKLVINMDGKHCCR